MRLATIYDAGMRVIQFYLDTGDCAFCNPTGPDNDQHAETCTFYELSDDDLKALLTKGESLMVLE